MSDSVADPTIRVRWRLLLGRKRPQWGLALAACIVVVFVVVAVAAPLLAPDDPNAQRLTETLQAPSAAHLLGTDEYGRDVLSRLMYAVRSSLLVGAIVAAVAGACGFVLALCAGYLGGVVDAVISRVGDVGLAFPTLVLALALVTALGVGVTSTIIALSIGFIPFFARVLRSTVLRIKQEPFVESARVTGVSPGRIIVRHVVPNLRGPLLVQLTMGFAFAVLNEAGLSFVGLGIQTPTPSLGNMIAGAQVHGLQAPWLTIAPGLTTAIIILTLLFIGDALRDASDPLTIR